MRILWLCNLVLPEFRELFGFKKAYTGGWIFGMWDRIKDIPDLEMGICLPIMNPQYMKDGVYGGHKYYSFPFSKTEKDIIKQITKFRKILTDFKPDIIHIWGTEYLHSFSMIEACEECGLLDRTIVDLQGMISYCARYITLDIPDKWINMETEDGNTIKKMSTNFEECGRYELKTLKKAKCVVGRTTWDKLVAKRINNQLKYFNCPRLLQEEFYSFDRRWSVEGCRKKTVFMSQGGYPIKGIHYMVKALAVVKERHSDVKLRIAGVSPLEIKGGKQVNPYGYYLKELIRDSDLEGNIEFIGACDASGMIEEYLSANVMVSSSTIENNCNSLCEAMILGVPVISSFVGGIPDIISHSWNGMLYPLSEPDILAGYICEIFENDTFSEALSEKAIETAIIRHDREKITEKMMDIYRQLLEQAT
jgi:glycosyltransferase involved in cell wall biosynthesis